MLVAMCESEFQLNKRYFAISHGYLRISRQLSLSYPLVCLLFNLNLMQLNMNFIFSGSDYIKS